MKNILLIIIYSMCMCVTTYSQDFLIENFLVNEDLLPVIETAEYTLEGYEGQNDFRWDVNRMLKVGDAYFYLLKADVHRVIDRNSFEKIDANTPRYTHNEKEVTEQQYMKVVTDVLFREGLCGEAMVNERLTDSVCVNPFSLELMQGYQVITKDMFDKLLVPYRTYKQDGDLVKYKIQAKKTMNPKQSI